MATRLDMIQRGWDIYDANGDKVANVSEADPNGRYIFATKGFFFPKDYYIPASAVTGVEHDRVYLNVTKDQINDLGWDQMPTETAGAYDTREQTSYTTDHGQRDRADYAATTGTAGCTAERTRDVDVTRGEEEMRLPLHEKQLRVEKQAHAAGEARLRRVVEEHEQNVTVPLQKEHLVVEEVEASADTPATGADFTEREIRVPLREEEARVTKEARLTGEARLREEVEIEERRVGDTVRRERLDVEDETAARTGREFTDREPPYADRDDRLSDRA